MLDVGVVVLVIVVVVVIVVVAVVVVVVVVAVVTLLVIDHFPSSDHVVYYFSEVTTNVTGIGFLAPREGPLFKHQIFAFEVAMVVCIVDLNHTGHTAVMVKTNVSPRPQLVDDVSPNVGASNVQQHDSIVIRGRTGFSPLFTPQPNVSKDICVSVRAFWCPCHGH